MTQIISLMLVCCLLFMALSTYFFRQRTRTNTRKKNAAQEELQGLTKFINALPAKILLLDENGFVVRSNELWDNFFCSIHKSVGEHFTQVLRMLNPLELHRNNKAITHIDAALNRSVPVSEFEYEATINGCHYWLQTTVRPMHEHNSRCVMLLQIDISQRKQAESERDLNIRLRRYAEQLLAQQKIALDEHAVVTATDLQGRIIYVNEIFVRLSGFARDKIIGQNYRISKSYFHPPTFFTI